MGWSPWVSVQSGATVALPAGRFLQYRAELRASAGERPALREVSFHHRCGELVAWGDPAAGLSIAYVTRRLGDFDRVDAIETAITPLRLLT